MMAHSKIIKLKEKENIIVKTIIVLLYMMEILKKVSLMAMEQDTIMKGIIR